MKEDEEYYVCDNLIQLVCDAAKLRKRKSAQLDPQARKTFCMDGINCVTAVLDDVKNNLQEEYCIYCKVPVTNMDGDDNNDAVEEVTVGKEKKKLGWDIVKHLYKKY